MASIDDDRPVRVVFVCLGNICRSPTAEAVMHHLAVHAGLEGRIEVDSAGTGGWHVGAPPDQRASAEAARRGVTLRSRARQFHPGDFYVHDLVVAMDRTNLADLRDLAPEHHLRAKAVLLRTFDPAAGEDDLDVPDPYLGGPAGFTRVYDMVEVACRGLLDHLQREHPDR